jgi:hypothetical protein
VLAVAAISVFMSFRPFSDRLTGDYPVDAAVTVSALSQGKVQRAIDTQPLMGSFSVILRAPFAAFAPLGDDSVALSYRLGCIPCVFALGLLALYLARQMRRRGQSSAICAAFVVFVLCNPLMFYTLKEGHPEEILAATLCIGAVIAAFKGKWLPAAVLLGLALGTKQWALIAVPPVLVAIGFSRVRLLAVAIGLAALLTVPLLLGNSEKFGSRANDVQGLSTEQQVRPFTVWRLVGTPNNKPNLGIMRDELGYNVPAWVVRVSRALIILLPIPLALVYWRRRERYALEDPLLLLAFVFLLRCLLDPVDGPYYHLPLILALASWEGLRMRGLPLISISVSVLLWMSINRFISGDQVPHYVFYLGWSLPLAVWLGMKLYAQDALDAARRRLNFSGRPPIGVAAR